MAEDDKGLNNYFEENGFQSKLLMKNIGSTFFFLMLYFFTWFILGLCHLLKALSPK
jgi:hypothetical protein